MKINCYILVAGKLQALPAGENLAQAGLAKPEETWLDIQEAGAEELRKFLIPLDLHPLQLTRCVDSANNPGVISFGKSLLMEYPAAFDSATAEPAYITILLQGGILVTIRHGKMPALDELIQTLKVEGNPPLRHLPQLIYEILDEFADLNAEAEVAIRDRIQHLSDALANRPDKVSTKDLGRLRAQVDDMVSLVENQLYCISGLNTSDNEALQDPHRKAFVQDLLSESEITQRGVYRLEARVKDLFNDYQAIGNDKVEKRLRLLTIISAITLPLGLLAGLLGMNVGGLPGTSNQAGFVLVMILMAVIAGIEFWFFARNGWFD